MKNNGSSAIARQYRDKYGKEITTTKLARIMYAENKLSFKDEENARFFLRYIEGKTGKKMAKSVNSTKYFIPESRPVNPYSLPVSDEEIREPHILKGHKRVLVLADVHMPFHSVSALTTCFDYAKKEKPDAIIANGDIIDCFQLSRWVKDPKKRHFAEELEQLKQFFHTLQKTFKCKIYFKFGNHELRYEHFLFQKAKELVGIEEFKFENIIKARTEGITIIEDKQIIKLNHLDLLHGHEFVQGIFNPVNVARGLFLRAKVSAMQAHSHKSSDHTEVDLHGAIKTTWSIGCLCGLSPDYAPYNSWNHGFALVDLDSNKKDFEVRNKRIYKGKVL